MLITRVILQDYGTYRGVHEFDFETDTKKPIVLVGGDNGAGKTTLFDSITLCLYGMSSMGKRITRRSYEQFLRRKIHRYHKGAASADHASVTVRFRFFHDGKESEYAVKRSWTKADGGVDESLDVSRLRNGRFGPLDSVERQYWQPFIEDLIPRGILDLFFFDGEKIARMAAQGTEDVEIKRSFRSLLGIGLVDQLHTDLQVNLTRNLTGGSKALKEDFEKYKAEKDESLRTTDKLKEKLVKKQTEMDSIKSEIDEAEAAISKIGGGFASGRDDAKTELAAARQVYGAARDRLAGLCSGVLPFSMIPGWMEELGRYLEEDESAMRHELGGMLLDAKFSSIKSKAGVSGMMGIGLDRNQAKRAAKLVSSILDRERVGHGDAPALVFGFSTEQTARIRAISSEAGGAALGILQEETQKLIEAGDRIDRLEASIASAPRDDEVGPLISKIGDLQSQSGALRTEVDHIEEKLSANRSMRQHLDSKLRDIVSQIYKSEKSKEHVGLTQDVQKVLEEFAGVLKARKIRVLEEYLLGAISVLLHKKRLIEGVTVDPNTFEVSLLGREGEALEKDMLSEGEKQMFATAVLWALAKTSGRPLPFMIDTPLARLDMSHRSNIVEKFLPSASHQVLVFSTDSEIDYKYYMKLGPHLARSYVMEHDHETGATARYNGYFWTKEGKKVVAVQ